MKKTLVLILIVAFVLSLGACGSADYSKEIIGTWKRVGNDYAETLTFYEDGKMENGRYELVGDQLKIVKGEWIEEYTIEIEGDTLILSWSEGLLGSDSSEYKRVK